MKQPKPPAISEVRTESSPAPRPIQWQAITALKPYPGNARWHPERQIEKIAASISRFGFLNPILVDADHCIVAGHGRFEAAKRLGWTQVPTLSVGLLSPAEIRAYRLADNRLAESSKWDQAALKCEVEFLVQSDFDLGQIGFELKDMPDISAEPVAKGNRPGSHRCVCPLCGAGHRPSRRGARTTSPSSTSPSGD